MDSLMGIVFTVLFCLVLESTLRFLGHIFGVYAIVQEKQAKVYVLFGNVVGVLTEPGFHFLWPSFGWQALLVNIFGQCYQRDLRLDQEYLRSTPVNSEEGAPMGIGVWVEMFISDPLAHVFKNTDPRGSLCTSVSNVSVKCLSNMPLAQMLESRHKMSQLVRKEVSPQSNEWGYKLGSVYIRKVHFRDIGMIRQIEEKVVNRLRQVTSAIRQGGTNQVNLIASHAEKEAATEFSRAASMRLQIVGKELARIGEDKEVANALFEILETQKVIAGGAHLTLIPDGLRGDLLTQMQISQEVKTPSPPAKT